MDAYTDRIVSFFTSERSLTLVRVFVVLLLSFIVARISRAAIARLMARRSSPQAVMVARRLVFYGIMTLAVVSALRELGFDLSVLLGAAGILTVAIGFASQTSASNLISGLFLIGEQPFVIGDVIKVGETTGEVLAIDLLSVKLRTFDNLYVRVPNESLVKSQIVNLTHFPIRRADLKLQVARKQDLARVRAILIDVAERNPLAMEEPKPLFLVEGITEFAQVLQFSVWGRREAFIDMKTTMQQEVEEALQREGVLLPVPMRTVRVLRDEPEVGGGPEDAALGG